MLVFFTLFVKYMCNSVITTTFAFIILIDNTVWVHSQEMHHG